MITEKALLDTINYIKTSYNLPISKQCWCKPNIIKYIQAIIYKNKKNVDVSTNYVSFNDLLFRSADDVPNGFLQIYLSKWIYIDILTNNERIIKEIIE